MDSSSSVFVLLLIAVALANAPFFTRRVFGLFGTEEKSLAMRLGELLIAYFFVGGIGLLLEQAAGQIFPQGWEFYAITGTLFVTLAFPGFVFRYLLKRHD